MNTAKKLLMFFLLFSQVMMHASAFLDVAQVHVDKVANKRSIVHKSPIEFKQAVGRYIKYTDYNYFQNTQRSSDENVSYKKELRYLFKNYGKFSALTLLSRLRSAHRAMIKHDGIAEGESYRYEQLCSALLLTCAQVFFNEMRGQILQALHDIDNLLVYWHYQHNHQVHYFFSKSPIKWIKGKEQDKEIAHNIMKLERKQRELYTLLGSLTEHAHSFTEVKATYENCYEWIEQLCEIAHGVKIKSQYTTDESRFDEIAAVLELKLKRISKFKSDCLASVAGAKKPSHFVRNWISYSALITATAYMAHYHSKNPEVMRSAFNAVHNEVGKFLILLLHPLQKIYERGKLVFSEEEKKEDPKNDEGSKEDVQPIDREKELIKLANELVAVGQKIPCDIAAVIARSNSDFRKGILDDIREVVKMLKNPGDGWVFSSSYTFDEKEILDSLNKIEKIIVPLKVGDVVANKQELEDYQAASKIVKSFVAHFKNEASLTIEGTYIRGSLRLSEFLLNVDEGYLDPLQGYTEVIDGRIIPIFEFIVSIADNIIAQALDLIKKADDLEIDATQKLKDLELTLMFTSLIPLGITGFGATKLYQWAKTRDYSSIRIALADVNALLIEAAHHLDDHDYGKLVYLICKLRHKSTYLKDSLSNEFLQDVAKLESKQYSAEIKRGIVENMFNKYAFLGKIAI